jgi:hypothetical protein
VPASTSSPATGAMAAWAAGLLRVRWLVRAPIGLYRARVGFLFGSRLLMLEHLGRKSGARHYVVLEVVAHPRSRHLRGGLRVRVPGPVVPQRPRQPARPASHVHSAVAVSKRPTLNVPD